MGNRGPSDYNRLSVAEKEAHNRLHEPPIRCPECEIAVQPEDLLSHMERRCPGRPEPHPQSRWISSRKAQELGVSRVKLHRLAQRGKIRTKDDRGARRYLLRDLAKYVARQRIDTHPRRRRPRAKPWTNAPHCDPTGGMDDSTIGPIGNRMVTQLRTMAERLGSLEATARRLDVPADTLRRAIAGARLRPGTRLLIQKQIEKAEGGRR